MIFVDEKLFIGNPINAEKKLSLTYWINNKWIVKTRNMIKKFEPKTASKISKVSKIRLLAK